MYGEENTSHEGIYCGVAYLSAIQSEDYKLSLRNRAGSRDFKLEKSISGNFGSVGEDFTGTWSNSGERKALLTCTGVVDWSFTFLDDERDDRIILGSEESLVLRASEEGVGDERCSMYYLLVRNKEVVLGKCKKRLETQMSRILYSSLNRALKFHDLEGKKGWKLNNFVIKRTGEVIGEGRAAYVPWVVVSYKISHFDSNKPEVIFSSETIENAKIEFNNYFQAGNMSIL